ncbi:hypothetical protein EV128_12211 [Rhizobium azibense]|nr:hypothetical protein EV128_12211 [Rhizobium azibense]
MQDTHEETLRENQLHSPVLSADELATIVALRSGTARVVIVDVAQIEDAPRQSGEELYRTAFCAVKNYNDWAEHNATEWTGWGDQIVPPGAEYWCTKSKQALAALSECGPGHRR